MADNHLLAVAPTKTLLFSIHINTTLSLHHNAVTLLT